MFLGHFVLILLDELLFVDQRVSQAQNSEFLDMMEKYFEKPLEAKVVAVSYYVYCFVNILEFSCSFDVVLALVKQFL